MDKDAAWREVHSTICRRIRDGIYPIGTRLPTYHQVAAEHGVSLAPVREAYRRLYGAGILQGQRGRGVYVRAVPAPDLITDPPVQGQLAALRREIHEIRAEIATVRDGLTQLAKLVDQCGAGAA